MKPKEAMAMMLKRYMLMFHQELFTSKVVFDGFLSPHNFYMVAPIMMKCFGGNSVLRAVFNFAALAFRYDKYNACIFLVGLSDSFFVTFLLLRKE